MLLAVDVDYRDNYALCAGILFEKWNSETPRAVYTSRIEPVAPYVPGEFYKRELPCILTLLEEHKLEPQIIIVDSYVYLDGSTLPGMGKYLFDTLEGRIPVIGVAKNSYKEIGKEYAVLRPPSTKALYVTCAGYPLEQAKENIQRMHGEFRIPALLKLADQQCRSALI